jgi:uncharacterized membrane protein YkvA (DUF1232 family)
VSSRYAQRPSPSLARRLLGLPLRAKARLLWRLVLDRRTGLLPKLVLMALAVYLASPIDLLPDFIPFVGQMDDAVVALVSLLALLLLVPRPVLLEHLERLELEAPR